MAPSDSVRNALFTVVIVTGRCLASEKGFTPWTTWSPCNRSCGYGIKRLKRQCVDPDLGCEGSVNHGVMCRLKDCPIDGQFTDWSQWTACNHPCGGGVRSRTRECTNPAPQHGGLPCTGDSSDTQVCNNHECPQQVDGQFTDWTQWTACNHPCGGGVRSRTRECTNPAPQHGGLPCTGDSSDTQVCNNHECPQQVNGQFTDWTQWTSCNVTCGGGTSGRTRACINPAPQNGGLPCSGSASDSRTCNTHNCTEPAAEGGAAAAATGEADDATGGAGVIVGEVIGSLFGAAYIGLVIYSAVYNYRRLQRFKQRRRERLERQEKSANTSGKTSEEPA